MTFISQKPIMNYIGSEIGAVSGPGNQLIGETRAFQRHGESCRRGALVIV